MVGIQRRQSFMCAFKNKLHQLTHLSLPVLVTKGHRDPSTRSHKHITCGQAFLFWKRLNIGKEGMIAGYKHKINLPSNTYSSSYHREHTILVSSERVIKKRKE